jgi:hypothetical protein
MGNAKVAGLPVMDDPRRAPCLLQHICLSYTQ